MDAKNYIYLNTTEMEWMLTDTPGVLYKSLRYDRLIKSGAVLIRMDENTSYPEHIHSNGEEILVLEGELIIGKQNFPAGSYVYSPPESRHHPRTQKGTLLFSVFHGKIINIK